MLLAIASVSIQGMCCKTCALSLEERAHCRLCVPVCANRYSGYSALLGGSGGLSQQVNKGNN